MDLHVAEPDTILCTTQSRQHHLGKLSSLAARVGSRGPAQLGSRRCLPAFGRRATLESAEHRASPRPRGRRRHELHVGRTRIPDQAPLPLRAIERFGIAEPDVSVKCCHAIAISGDMDQLVRFLPTAVMRTFNRHPRLRALVVKSEEFTAEVRPQIKLDDVAAKKLLRVREISDSDEDVSAWKNWNQFVQSETHVPFDRFTQFMFYLTVWVNRAEGKARFFLFSDHIMSDGDSGMIFVNDTLEDVALLSIEAVKPVKELPLRPSLYDMWFTSPWWLKPVAKTVVALVGGSAFVNFMKVFKPVLTPRADQQDFGIPFKQNSTTLLSQAGSPTNMRDTLRKCKEEASRSAARSSRCWCWPSTTPARSTRSSTARRRPTARSASWPTFATTCASACRSPPRSARWGST